MNENYKILIVSYLTLLVSFTGFSQSIIRGPYLQKGTPTSVVVKWRTDSNDTSIIEYGTSSTSYNMTFSETTQKTEHELEITGLSPDTKYFYRLGTNGAIFGGSTGSSDLYFKTHPTVGTSQPYRFWVLGDCGSGGDYENETYGTDAEDVRDAYYNNYTGSDDTDGILFLGDNAYFSGTDAEHQRALFDIYHEKLKNTIAWSCLGNHDGFTADSDTQTGPYYDIFTFPTAGESGGMSSGTEAYYSFDYGNIHFIVLDSYETDRSVGGSMHNWALNDIQSTTQKWIVAFWHHPPYSKGSHNSDSESELIDMRVNFLPMLEANGVDLVLGGHSHAYERSFFINGHYGLSSTFSSTTHTIANGAGNGKDSNAYLKTSFGTDAGKGAVYVVTGSAGKKTGGDLNHQAMYVSLNELGSSVLEVDGENLTVKFIRETTGVVEDYFTITKGPDYTYDGAWSPNTPPTGTNIEDIYIKTGSPILTNDITARSVNVYPDAGLTITGNTLTATNSFNLSSTSNKYSSLISDGTILGTINYNRFTSKVGPIGTNDLVSDPLADPISTNSQTFGNFDTANPNLAAPTSGDLNRRSFGPFNNDTGLYQNYHTTTNASTPLEAGRGYRAATEEGGPLKFTGIVNTGTVSVPIEIGAGSEWNLIGNPYPSYIKLSDFLVENNSKFNTTSAGVYGYDGNATDGWSIWNVLYSQSHPGSLIAPGQGFFVAAKDPGPVNVSFTPVMRNSGMGDDFIIGRISDPNIALSKIGLTNFNENFTTDIYFVDGATRGLDPGYDAGAFQGNAAGIFTHLVEDNTGVEMAIQALPYEDFNNVVVPLGIKTDAGFVSSIGMNSASDLPSNINVYLEDNVANTFTLLNSTDYTFTPSQNLTGTGRFFLHYSSSTLSAENEAISGLQIFATSSPRNLYVNGKLLDTTVLDLYDLQGRLVLNLNLDMNSISNKINVDSLSTGIYIVKLKIGGSTKTQKVILR